MRKINRNVEYDESIKKSVAHSNFKEASIRTAIYNTSYDYRILYEFP